MTKYKPHPMSVKVLHVTNDLSVGGSEIMLYRLLAEMDRERFDPVVFSLTNGGVLREVVEALNISVFSAGMTAPLPSTASLSRLIRLARSIKPDALVEFCPCGTAFNFYTLPNLNMSVASDPHNSWQVRTKGKTLKALQGDSVA